MTNVFDALCLLRWGGDGIGKGVMAKAVSCGVKPGAQRKLAKLFKLMNEFVKRILRTGLVRLSGGNHLMEKDYM